MSDTDRRTFLKLMGTGAMALSIPPSIRKALAIPAHNRTRSINDVEHVIFLMQENRSFDHYFGTLRGVRGFADPHAVTLPNGQSRSGTSPTAAASCCRSGPTWPTWARRSCPTRRTAGTTRTPPGTAAATTSGCPTRASTR